VSTAKPGFSAAAAVVNRIVVPELAQSITPAGAAGAPSNPVISRASVSPVRSRSTLPPNASTAAIVARVSALSSGARTRPPAP
jgi:hypothetical protein